MSNSTPEELIAQAREIMRVCPDSSRILLQLADLAEAEGRLADEADARLQWQSIATAPKDGTSILGWCGDIRDGGYGIQHLYWDIRWQVVGGDLEHDYEPTLWLPTPAAPAGEIAALKQEYFAATLAIEQTLHDTEQRSDAARAEVERLKLEVAALRAERDHLATTRMEASAEIDRLQTERAALAQENARLINEVGTLDATAREQRQRAEVLARGIAAYRSGSFTLAQVWENEEGKAVT